MIQSIRSFFLDEGFLEVQTPLLIRAPLPEPAIETFSISGRGARPRLFLVPSPESHMKRMMAEGFEKIFQIGPVFRRNERGARHLPEFTMLEWYRAESDYTALATDCQGILRAAAKAAGWKDETIGYCGRCIDISGTFPSISVEEAFLRYAGWRPGPIPDSDRFNEDLITRVEPALDCSTPMFLKDFPASCASLARLKPSNPDVAERIELYAGGLELANGFSELADPYEQEQRFRLEAERRRELGLAEYPWPAEFLASLKDLPECAGMALGIDRLVMLVTDTPTIDDVVAFAEHDGVFAQQ